MTTTEQQLRSALHYLLGAYHCTHDTNGTSAEIVSRIDACTHAPCIRAREALARRKPADQASDGITITDHGTTLNAHHGGKHIGSAARQCIGGSRGQSWYWAIQVRGLTGEARRKPEARAELLRLARQAVEPVACADPDCGEADCTGGHGLMRCPSTGQVNRNLATVADRWTCCGGLYPDHAQIA